MAGPARGNGAAPDKASPRTTGTGSSSVRTRCRYGDKCRNNRPRHRRDYSHPGDDDYEAGEAEGEAEAKAMVWKLFSRWDVDGSGDLDSNQFVLFLQLCGMDRQVALDVFKVVDKNRNGRIELAEFVSWVFLIDRDSREQFSQTAWRAPDGLTRGWSLTPAENEDMQKLQELLRVTDPHNLGTGRDVRDKGVRYSKLEVVFAWKLNKPRQAQMLELKREDIKSQLQAIKKTRSVGRIRTKLSHLEDWFQVDASVNENIFLHGTKPEAVLAIINNGLSEKVSGGLFGCGVYLAEDPSKIDQYCTMHEDGGAGDELKRALYDETGVAFRPGVYYCFVVRALMGCPVITDNGEEDIDTGADIWWSDECRQLSHIPGVVPPLHYNSLVVELGDYPTSHVRHREFVHFDGNACTQIQYVIAYRRV